METIGQMLAAGGALGMALVIIFGLILLTLLVSGTALFKGSSIVHTEQAVRESAERERLISAFKPAIEPGGGGGNASRSICRANVAVAGSAMVARTASSCEYYYQSRLHRHEL